MRTLLALLVGKTLRILLALRGGGSALPGLVAEKISPTFLQDTLGKLPYGVVVISGTNGKTTTTKLVTELLQGQGLKVLTNGSGSNFIRGVIASILEHKTIVRPLDAGIAVLELDEAHATHFVEKIQPRYSLLLNVLRDQLDRFGELDYTAGLLQTIANATTDVVVLNGDDPYLSQNRFRENTTAQVHTYGANKDLAALLVNDRKLHNHRGTEQIALAQHTMLVGSQPGMLTINCQNKNHTGQTQLAGLHNMHNTTAAVALINAILEDATDFPQLFETLSQIKPAFGRGETITVGTTPIELHLVKNPSGFQMSLASATHEPSRVMIAINDDYADGRDMSWLWDVPFGPTLPTTIHTATGRRAHDMALRLHYDNISVTSVEPSLTTALDNFISETEPLPTRIYCTYTAMIRIRKHLSKLAQLEPTS